MDSTEPDHLDFKPEDFDTQTAMGSFRKVRNAYPLMSVGGVYNNQRNETSDKRVFILTRSGFAGQQRYGSNVWSGDVASTWNDLRNQVPAGLNFTMTGNPNYNSDIGGFFAGRYNNSWNDGSGAKNPLYQELYVRWLQFGAFNPMMRSHGTDVPREIYNFGEKGEPIYDAIEKTINLRYSLLPYIYSTSWDVTNNQSSYMRPLVMDFPKDKNGWDINDEYMFGKALLVAPVLNAQYTDESKTRPEQCIKTDFTQKKSSDVYLPAGTVWYDFYTDKKYDGGQKIDIETTVDMIPLFVRAGSIVPIGPKVQYASEKDWSELQLNVYQGANGTFVLYEDEGDNYNYEKGIYSEIPMKWDDKNRKFTIESRKGEYPGMIKERTFNIKMQDGTTKKVKYNGRKQTIAF